MNKVKVLIIDDEILAIEHLKQLVPWEELDFVVEGETVYPRKGLELAEKLKPDLVFVDIRMPGMDGLALSERLAATGSQAKIVILTSYKEFEYVKRSLRIGVLDYWVKHELTPEGLTKELVQIKEGIYKERRLRKNMCKPLFGMALDGREVSADEWKTLASYMRSFGSRYVYIALAIDEPFPVTGKEGKREERVRIAWDEAERDGFRIIETFAPAGKKSVGVLAAFAGAASRLYMHEELFRFSRYLKQFFERHIPAGKTVSVACSPVFDDASGLLQASEWTERTLRQRIFAEEGQRLVHVHYSGSGYGGDNAHAGKPRTDWQAALLRLSGHIEERRSDKIDESIEDLFASVKAHARAEELRQVCESLSEKLDKRRTEIGKPAYREEERDEIEGSQMWMSVSGIAQWFKDQFRAVMAEAAHDAYSSKIKKAIQYIHRHYAEEIGIEQIAEQLDISGDHLRHCFKNETRRTILDYLTELRVEKAKHYLAAGEYKLYEVAEKVGYRNSHYFSKVFQRVTGSHPLVYAERKRER